MTLDTAPGIDADVRIEATQLEGFDQGPRLGVWWTPARREPRGAVLCVQPLCNERATARHALAEQAWRLAARGWVVLLMDLFGTGDSPGEPGAATLDGWRSDLLRGAMLARQRHVGPNILWGVRAGALLAADIAVALDQLVDGYVFWDAPTSGAMIASLPAEGGGLAPWMLAELRELHMQPPPVAEHGTPPSVLFVEIAGSRETPAELSKSTDEMNEQWREAGYVAAARLASDSVSWTSGATSSGAPPTTFAGLPTATYAATEEFLEDLR